MLERETKNTTSYQEGSDGDPPAIDRLYFQKWLLGDRPPKKLTVMVAEADK